MGILLGAIIVVWAAIANAPTGSMKVAVFAFRVTGWVAVIRSWPHRD